MPMRRLPVALLIARGLASTPECASHLILPISPARAATSEQPR